MVVFTVVELAEMLQSGPFDKTKLNVAECVPAEADPDTVIV